MINVAAFCSDPSAEGTSFGESSDSWATNASTAELLDQFSGWEREVTSLLKVRARLRMPRTVHAPILLLIYQCMDKPLKWAIHALKPLNTYSSSRVALIGDAVRHATTSDLSTSHNFITSGACYDTVPRLRCRASYRGHSMTIPEQYDWLMCL